MSGRDDNLRGDVASARQSNLAALRAQHLVAGINLCSHITAAHLLDSADARCGRGLERILVDSLRSEVSRAREFLSLASETVDEKNRSQNGYDNCRLHV